MPAIELSSLACSSNPMCKLLKFVPWAAAIFILAVPTSIVVCLPAMIRCRPPICIDRYSRISTNYSVISTPIWTSCTSSWRGENSLPLHVSYLIVRLFRDLQSVAQNYSLWSCDLDLCSSRWGIYNSTNIHGLSSYNARRNLALHSHVFTSHVLHVTQRVSQLLASSRDILGNE